MASNRFFPSLPVVNLLYAATLWGLVWYPLQELKKAGIPGLWATLIAYAAALVVILIFLRGSFADLWRFKGRLAALALAAGWCNAAFFVAVAEGDPARVVLLFYLAPVWSIILGVIFLREQPDVKSLVISILAIIGAMFMLWNPKIGMPWPHSWVDWLSLSSGFAFAVTNVLVRNLSDASQMVKAQATFVGVVIVALVWILLTQSPVPVAAELAWATCIALGVFGIATMTLAVQYGVSHLPIYRSAVILLFEVLVTVVSTYFLAQYHLTVWGWIGGLFIVAASLVSAFGARSANTSTQGTKN